MNDEQMLDDAVENKGGVSESFYSGVEPVDVGDLSDVKEQKFTVPATRGVRFKIKKAENWSSKDNALRSISLQLIMTEGIIVGEELNKYKGKVLFTRVGYYADPNGISKSEKNLGKKYSEIDFFKKKQHLVQLKYLLNATGLVGEKIDGYFFEKLESAPEFTGNILVKWSKYLDDFENDIVGYKALEVGEQV